MRNIELRENEEREVLLSIVIPIRGMTGKLNNLAQTLSSGSALVEFLIVIDGPDEALEEELKELVKDQSYLSSIYILKGAFNSPGYARNFGLEQANGKWISFWDSDDVGYADVAEYLVASYGDSKDAIKASYILTNVGSDNNLFKDARRENQISRYRQPGLWRYVFNQKLLNNMTFSNLKLGEDQIFLSAVMETNPQILDSSLYIYKYFENVPDSLTNSKSKGNEILKLFDLLLSRNVTDNLFQVKSTKILIARSLLSISACNDLDGRKKIFTFILALRKNGLSLLKYILILVLDSIQFKRDRWLRSGATHEVVLAGGLGNQLFQMAFALSQANLASVKLNTNLANQREPGNSIADTLEDTLPLNVTKANKLSETKLSRKFTSLALRTSASSSSRFLANLLELIGSIYFTLIRKEFTKVHIARGVGEFATNNTRRNNLYIGYFQSSTWASNPNVKNQMSRLYFGENRFPELSAAARILAPVIVHVRLGDYVKEHGIGILDERYYKEALSKIVPMYDEAPVWLFSDEPEKAINFLPQGFRERLTVIDHLGPFPLETLEIMRNGGAYVIANSTFSWWAANLSHQKKAHVIAPEPWFRNSESPINIIPTNWMTTSGWEERVGIYEH